jgi:amidase
MTTVGLSCLCEDVAEDDSVTVKLYLKAGAIPIVRGNVPQSALSLDTQNLVWGHARNPHD